MGIPLPPSNEFLALDRLIERVVLLLLLSFVRCLTLPLDVLLLFLGAAVAAALAMESRFVPKTRVVVEVSCVEAFMAFMAGGCIGRYRWQRVAILLA